MPYLQVDLDGKRKWPLIAAGLGVHEGFVAKGFLDLWEMCWRDKTDSVGTLNLELYFGAKGERVAELLCHFGFLEPAAGGFRVRGADKYLRIAEARSAGGKKAAGNLRRGPNLPGSSREPAGSQPGSTSGSRPALTPITEHQSPNTEQLLLPPAAPSVTPLALVQEPKAKRPKPDKPTDPRHAPMVAALCDTYASARGGARYAFAGKDAAAVTRLLGMGSDAEILGRWRHALSLGARWPGTSSLPGLADRWNELTTTGPPRQPADVTRGTVRAESQDHGTHTGEVNVS